MLLLSSCGSKVRHLRPSPGPVVFLGDSLTEGLGAPAGQGYVDVLAERFGLEFVNKGIKGHTTAQGLARLQKDVLDLNPSLVVLELGGNDVLQKMEPEVTFKNLDEILRQLDQKKVPVLLVGIRRGLLGDRYRDGFERLAESYKTAYMPNILRGILTNAELKYDSIHPNAKGYAKIADRMEPILRPLLEGVGKL